MKIVLSFLFGLSLNAQADLRDQPILLPAIVRGDVVPEQQSGIYQATVMLTIVNKAGNNKLSNCTGVLIAQDIVMTAAHCLEKHPTKLDIEVQFADIIVSAKSYIVHPDYATRSHRLDERGRKVQVGGYNDIALILLREPMAHLTPALLPPFGARIRESTSVLMVGFGQTDFYSPVDGKLRWVSGKASEQSHNRIVIWGEGTTCLGDSGGPSYIKKGEHFMVVGIVSTGNCEYRSSQTAVANFVDWIEVEVAKLRSIVAI